MHRTEIDGVPVLWAPGPPPLEAALIFGCGVRDERFRTLGVSHMIEHLAMGTLPRLFHSHNAEVDEESTRFTAEGTPDEVTEFLGRVCAALADLPLDRMAKEAGVLHAEGGSIDQAAASALTWRYGMTGLGLLGWVGPGPDRIEESHVREYLERYFVRENAVLTLTGPPPAGLRLPLPSGTRPMRPTQQPLVASPGPAVLRSDAPSVGVALLGERSAALRLGIGVLIELVTATARHERGLSYDVGLAIARPGPGRHHAVVTVDARQGTAGDVAQILWEAVRKLAASGPTLQELADECAAARAEFADPRNLGGLLSAGADELLFDYPDIPTEELLREYAAVTPEDVAAALTATLDSALVVVPDGTESMLLFDGAHLPAVACYRRDAALPTGTIYRPSLFDRASSGVARRFAIVPDSGGISMRDGDGDIHRLDYDEIVGVQRGGAGRVLFGGRGCVIPVLPGNIPGCAPLVAAIDERVPAELGYEESEFRAEPC